MVEPQFIRSHVIINGFLTTLCNADGRMKLWYELLR